MARSLGRRRIRGVFGVPPSAVPRDRRAERPAPRGRVERPPVDIDTVRLKPPPGPRRKR